MRCSRRRWRGSGMQLTHKFLKGHKLLPIRITGKTVDGKTAEVIFLKRRHELRLIGGQDTEDIRHGRAEPLDLCVAATRCRNVELLSQSRKVRSVQDRRKPWRAGLALSLVRPRSLELLMDDPDCPLHSKATEWPRRDGPATEVRCNDG